MPDNSGVSTVKLDLGVKLPLFNITLHNKTNGSFTPKFYC